MVFIGYIEDDEILCQSKNEIIIFGAGNTGKNIFQKLVKMGIGNRVIAFADNAESLWNTFKDGKKIVKPGEAFVEYKDAEFVIASIYDKEIAEQLANNNIANVHLAIV